MFLSCCNVEVARITPWPELPHPTLHSLLNYFYMEINIQLNSQRDAHAHSGIRMPIFMGIG